MEEKLKKHTVDSSNLEWIAFNKDKEELFEQIEQYFLIRARFETDRLR